MGNENQQLVEPGDYTVEMETVVTLEHECDPLSCRESGSCCAAHDVWVNDEERRRILEWGQRAVERFDCLPVGLCTGGGPFRQLGPDLYVMEEGSEGICVWAYRGEHEEILCALHTVAVEVGVSPHVAKPRGCGLWPLCVSDDQPPIVTVQPGADKYPCNRIVPGRENLHPGTEELLEALDG